MRRTLSKSGDSFALDSDSFQMVLFNLFDIVFRIHRSGEIRYCSCEDETQCLVQSGDCVGRNFENVLGKCFAKEIADRITSVFEKGELVIFETGGLGNCEGEFYEVRMIPGTEDEAIVLFREITGERARQARLESQERLINMIDNMPVMMVAFDESGKIAIWNRECERVTGYTKEEMLGSEEALARLYPDAISRREIKKYLVELDSPFRDMELTLVCKEGDNRTVNWSNISRDFPVPGWKSWAVGLDITERLKDRHKLERLFQSLREKNEELESLAHITSHDLRSPFVNVKGFSGELSRMCKQLKELLADVKLDEAKRKKLDLLLDEDMPEALYFIDTGITRMDNLLEGLAKLSRIGRVEMNIEEIDVHQVVDEALSTMRYLIDQKGIEVEIGQLCPARGDAGQVLQVLSNLIKNAVHYMDSSRRGRIRISGAVQGDESVFCIEDNGVGIRVESQKEIFELFKRLSPDGQIEGEGVGLAIVKRIISKHNGRVWVESEPGCGSKFFFTLPLGNGE